MKNSFLIKNHDASNFDVYYQQMRKRKAMGGSLAGTMGMSRYPDGSPMMRKPQGADTQIFHVKGKRPAARDGHTGVIF